jgi:hypothetical protein
VPFATCTMPATRPARSQVVVLSPLPGRVSLSWRQFDACPGLCGVTIGFGFGFDSVSLTPVPVC